MSKTKYKLDHPERVLDTTRFGRIDKNTSAQWLEAVLLKCPELAPFIIEDTGEEEPPVKVKVITVGEETTMVAPKTFKVTTRTQKASKKASK